MVPFQTRQVSSTLWKCGLRQHSPSARQLTTYVGSEEHPIPMDGRPPQVHDSSFP